MIKKAIYFFIVLCFGYSIFVAFFAPSWWSATQDTEQENLVKAQNYLYSEKAYTNVIIGSSLSERIIADSLPDTYNLALGGLGIYDGLNILAHQKRLPKMVFVEINYVFREEDKNFSATLFSPAVYYAREKISALRADKQPISVLGNVIANTIYRVKDLIRGKGSTVTKNPATTITSVQVPVKLADKMVHDAYLSFFRLPTSSTAAKSFSVLKKAISSLEKRGVKFCFFEMPVDNQLEDLPLPAFIRNSFYTNFPRSGFKYIARPNWNYVETVDGQHLSAAAAKQYTVYFKRQLE